MVVRPMQGVWALAEKEGKPRTAASAAGTSTVFAETVAAKIGEKRERRRRRRIAIRRVRKEECVSTPIIMTGLREVDTFEVKGR